MRSVLVNIFLKTWLFLERLGISFVKVSSITPGKRTIRTFSLFKKVYQQAEKENLKVWVTGSWALTGRLGDFFKNINDIDFTMRKKEEEKKFAQILQSLGFVKKGQSPMGANRYFDSKAGIEIDFGSITYPGTIYYQIPLNENETVKINDFKFLVIPKQSQLNLYKNLLFCRGRNLYQDLIKIKILTLAK